MQQVHHQLSQPCAVNLMSERYTWKRLSFLMPAALLASVWTAPRPPLQPPCPAPPWQPPCSSLQIFSFRLFSLLPAWRTRWPVFVHFSVRPALTATWACNLPPHPPHPYFHALFPPKLSSPRVRHAALPGPRSVHSLSGG